MIRRNESDFSKTGQPIMSFSVQNNLSNDDDSDKNYTESASNIQNDDKSYFTKKRKKPIFCQHKKWTKDEDNLLCQLVNKYGENDWKHLYLKMPNRNMRQCKDRWNYYLNPQLKFVEWTEEEDNLLFNKIKEIGPKWTKIAKCFENRTDAMIKNRYNALKRMNKLPNDKSSENNQTGIKTQAQSNEVIQPDQICSTTFLNQEGNSEDDFFSSSENDEFNYFVC